MHYHPQPSRDGKWLVYGSKRDEPVPVAGLVLAGHEAKVPADGLGVREPLRVVDERGLRLRRPGPTPGMFRS